MNEEKLWKKCVEFHGHECGGLTIGFKAALLAAKLLELSESDGCISKDEQVVCIAENDACGIDAIQVILGCSVGKGNLLFHMRGKSAYSFYNRSTGKSLRLVLRPAAREMTRQESFAYYQSCAPEEMFEVKETPWKVPEKARIFRSLRCDCCGETASENMMRLEGDRILCLDCYESYNRFDV
ncbi:MAG: TraR/DksA C4-type zinc finger protein [Clostridiales bacterium]|nr:TraR/DksA C4-type zinc finger protein [Clostridiales bacterium]